RTMSKRDCSSDVCSSDLKFALCSVGIKAWWSETNALLKTFFKTTLDPFLIIVLTCGLKSLIACRRSFIVFCISVVKYLLSVRGRSEECGVGKECIAHRR